MIAACVKWVADAREPGDERFAGISPADRAAVELALRRGEHTGDEVTVLTVGPPAAERALREAIASGATRAVRIDADPAACSDHVAALLAVHVATAATVWCGDHSLDRGTGSVPAFLAALLGVPQALGVVDVSWPGTQVRAVRRLDGGRREVLQLGRGVISVEGSVAMLRRAPLTAMLRAAEHDIVVVDGGDAAAVTLDAPRPFRPRAQAMASPRGATLDRLRALTDAGSTPRRGESVALEPAAAAQRIVDALHDWGYLHPAMGAEVTTSRQFRAH